MYSNKKDQQFFVDIAYYIYCSKDDACNCAEDEKTFYVLCYYAAFAVIYI